MRAFALRTMGNFLLVLDLLRMLHMKFGFDWPRICLNIVDDDDDDDDDDNGNIYIYIYIVE